MKWRSWAYVKGFFMMNKTNLWSADRMIFSKESSRLSSLSMIGTAELVLTWTTTPADAVLMALLLLFCCWFFRFVYLCWVLWAKGCTLGCQVLLLEEHSITTELLPELFHCWWNESLPSASPLESFTTSGKAGKKMNEFSSAFWPWETLALNSMYYLLCLIQFKFSII